MEKQQHELYHYFQQHYQSKKKIVEEHKVLSDEEIDYSEAENVLQY